jgi:hypothetical protein
MVRQKMIEDGGQQKTAEEARRNGRRMPQPAKEDREV